MKEEDIRPAEAHEEYLKLSKDDAVVFFQITSAGLICRALPVILLMVSLHFIRTGLGMYFVKYVELFINDVEHVHSPLSFLQALLALTKPGGYVLITGLGVDGYDIQTLWEQSKSISPPHHINFMSVKGFELLFKRVGFIDIDLFTPGELDVEIVSKAMAATPGLADKNRFAALLALKGKQVQKQFQEFLKKNLLSSHVWVIAKRPDIV